jgi:aminoglycoside phosphotransferase family enzyme/predicted kinase
MNHRNEARRLALQRRLIAGLHDPAAYAHPVSHVEQIDTHISTLLLAGDYVYKLKKPLAPGFLDFRSRRARHHFCVEELRLNQRTAPGIYLDVVPVLGSCARPRFGTAGETTARALDWAVRMRRFDDHQLYAALAERSALTETHIDRLAQTLAAFHAAVAVAPPPAGAPPQVLRWARANLAELLALPALQPQRPRLQALLDWSLARHAELAPLLAVRQTEGRVRVCHGDLHLGNIAWLNEAPLLFDALEFNAELREIDVISDLAFPVMDLLGRGLPALAWRLLNGWFEASGDFAGAALLGWLVVYRALVRAKVAALQAELLPADAPERLNLLAAAQQHIELAEQQAGLATHATPQLVLCWGLSGAGKSSVAQHIAEALGALRLRSDVERKRLYGLAPTARPDAAAASNPPLYSQQATQRTYARLVELAGGLLGAGLSVVIDAASLKQAERRSFQALAQQMGAGFVMLECCAPDAVLRERISARQAAGQDASDATLAVLTLQQRIREPLAAAELAQAQQLDTDRPRAALAEACRAWAAQLRGQSTHMRSGCLVRPATSSTPSPQPQK